MLSPGDAPVGLPPFWAKLATDAEPPTYHPLQCHLLDVAGMAEAMWDEVLPSVVRTDIATGLGLSVAKARAWVVCLAALHDLGKLSPAFQLRPDAGALNEAIQQWARSATPSGRLPHGVVSVRAIHDFLTRDPYLVDSKLAWQLAVVSGGHHGVFPQPIEWQRAPLDLVGQKPWDSARLDVAQLVARCLDVRREPPSRLAQSTALVVAGLISVADWLASDEAWFPHAAQLDAPPAEMNLASYLNTSRTRARTALRELGWFTWATDDPARPFSTVFPDLVPRPLQQAVQDFAGGGAGPRLVVVEAPTGEGKTEAALYLASQWAAASGRRGFYVALPTQATSEQMFNRVHAFLGGQTHPDVVQLQLLHGHAALSAEFALLGKGATRLPRPTSVALDEDRNASVVASAWFTHRKRGLLAPFGVGTIDQVLLAALQTRHVFVRLLGLTRRAIVIDEVHAYDTYMSALLERLLEWLAALGSPVVLLSATLPSTRRAALCEAYMRGLDHAGPAVESTSYPRISSVQLGGGVIHRREVHVVASSRSTRRLQLSWLENEGVSEWLREALTEGGCAAIVCNTVSRAQRMFEMLRPGWSEIADDGGPVLDLLHARFPPRWRREREQRLFDRLGPHPTKRPSRAIVVATQVVEQSLDLDFDAMVTDLAPVDLLLQRAGRLHRHARPRPMRLKEPRLWIRGHASVTAEDPSFDPGTAAVYHEHVLLRTWLALQGRDAVEIPDEVAELIDRVYQDGADWPEKLPAPLVRRLRASWEDLKAERERHTLEAKDRWVKSPRADVPVWEFSRDPRDEDAPDVHQSFQALTRLAPPSVNVVCLRGHPDAPSLWDSGTMVPLQDLPSAGMARQLLEWAIPVQRRGLVQVLLDRPSPPGWRRSPWLRHHRALVFDDAGVAVVGRYRLTLDRDRGLVVESS